MPSSQTIINPHLPYLFRIPTLHPNCWYLPHTFGRGVLCSPLGGAEQRVGAPRGGHSKRIGQLAAQVTAQIVEENLEFRPSGGGFDYLGGSGRRRHFLTRPGC